MVKIKGISPFVHCVLFYEQSFNYFLLHVAIILQLSLHPYHYTCYFNESWSVPLPEKPEVHESLKSQEALLTACWELKNFSTKKLLEF